jgi:integrase
MPTIRKRGDTIQAIVRIKKGGVLIHQEAESWKINGQSEARIRRLAQEWGLAIEARIRDQGVAPVKLKSWTLAELLEEQSKELKRHGDPRRTKLAELEQLQPYFVKDRLSDLTSHTFSKFAAKRRAEGAGPTTILHNLSTLRGVLNAAKPLHGLSVNGDAVAEAIKALSTVGAVAKSNSRDRRPTPDEWKKLMDYFDRMAYHPTAEIPMRKVCELAVALPRRLGELTEALWENHNKDRHLLTLLDTKHPTRVRNEVIPLPVPARSILASLPVTDPRILPYKPESISAAFTRACKRCEIDDLHFHDLRHEGISRLFEQGLQIQEVAVISGHLSWQMLKRYTHLGTSALMEKLNAGLGQAQEASPQPA